MTSQELELCTLIILHREASLLLAEHAGDSLKLPEIAIPKYTRVAEELTVAVQNRWGLDGVVLFRPELDGVENMWTVLTPLDSDHPLHAELEWVPFERFSADPSVAEALRQWSAYEDGSRSGLFAHRAWLGELQAWASNRVRPLGLRLTGNVKQYNCGPAFALLRLETESAAVWFKATGEPNRHEFSVTRELIRRAPEFLPEVIVFHEEWNGWLMREAEGLPIDLCGRQSGWSSAGRALATMQTRFIGEAPLLERAGCRDRSRDWIALRIDGFFENAEEWMQRQPAGTAAKPLAPAELRDLSARAREMLDEIHHLGIRETLVHGDINSGNLIVSPIGCLFLDWAEAWIGHPFISFEYLRELQRKTHPDRGDWFDSMRAAYAEPWSEAYGQTVVERTFELSVALAALVYALVCAETPCLSESHRTKREQFLRSLIRRFDRETRTMGRKVAA